VCSHGRTMFADIFSPSCAQGFLPDSRAHLNDSGCEMTTTPKLDSCSPNPSSQDAAVAARRQAILRGLGKGGVALAALSPVVGHATRSFKVPNAELPAPSFGYCTVSGFQSAAISGNPAPVQCGAFEPKDFVGTPKTLIYEDLITAYSIPATGTANQRVAAALNAYFGSGVALTGPNIRDTLRAANPVKLLVSVPMLKAVIIPGDLGGLTSPRRGTELRATAAFPAAIDATTAFNVLFPSSSDTRTLLEVLQDGVASATPASANCYVLAAYLSVGASGATLPPSLDRTYIRSQYTASGYGATSKVYKFFRSLCLA